MTVQCALAGEKVAWVPRAITYDEQPLDYAGVREAAPPVDQRDHSGGRAVSATDRTPDDSGPPGSASGT